MAKELSKKQMMEMLEQLMEENQALKTKAVSSPESDVFVPRVSKLSWTAKQREELLTKLYVKGDAMDIENVPDSAYNIAMTVKGSTLYVKHDISKAFDRSKRGNPICFRSPYKANIIYKGEITLTDPKDEAKTITKLVNVFYTPGSVTIVPETR